MRAIARTLEIVVAAAVAGAMLGGCSTMNNAAQPPLRTFDGVTCGGDTCGQGAVCCIMDNGLSCKPGSIDAGGPFSVSADVAADPALCGAQPFLACDDQQDCPTGTMCCLESRLTVAHTACVAPALGGAGCGEAAQVCGSDSDCPGTHCKPDHSGLPTDGHVSVCQ